MHTGERGCNVGLYNKCFTLTSRLNASVCQTVCSVVHNKDNVSKFLMLLLLLFRKFLNRIQIIPYIKDYVAIIAIFCVDVHRIYMNNAYNNVNTYSMSVSPWKMLLRGLEFDLIIPCTTSH